MIKLKNLYIIYWYQKLKELPAKRSIWVKYIFSEERRLAQGMSDNLVLELREFDYQTIYDPFRLSVEMLDELLALMGRIITKKHAVKNSNTSPNQVGDFFSILSCRWLYEFHWSCNIVAETCSNLGSTCWNSVS